MRTTRPILAIILTAALASAAPAKGPAHPVKTPPAPTIAKVEAAPFQLKQVRTQKLSDTTSQSLYLGETTLAVTPCGSAEPVLLPVRVELKTTTMLNGCGDGFTEGAIRLIDTANGHVITGKLSAVNANFGELQGLVEGVVPARPGKVGPPAGVLKAVFQGVFVLDENNEYTLVDSTARGVLVTRPIVPPAK